MIDNKFFKNKGPFTLSEIANICKAEIVDKSKSNLKIFEINTMYDAIDGEICFFYDKKSKEKATQIKSTACVTTEELSKFVKPEVVTLISDNPKLAYLNLIAEFYEEYKPTSSIAKTAIVDSSAKIGTNCFIGDYVVIGEDVAIGDNCTIEPNVTIARGCVIGNNCRIGANASVSYCVMGNDCYVYTGARIGADGFGFLTQQGKHKRILQLGKVVIGNDVEIGANTCIDRGALDDTIIGSGVKIDNLVQIAHGDKLGQGCIIVAQAGIAGSCTLGNYVVLGGQVGVADHLKIGDFAQVAGQSGIIQNVETNAVVMGCPAVPIKDFMRQASFLQKNTKKS